HLSAEFPLCQPEHLPCCPLPVNSAAETCPACQVTVTVAEKEESKSERLHLTPRAATVHDPRPRPLIHSPQRELTQGLRYHPAVFQLKDDLRI
ncbi:MAG TPA: hypothetical protein VIM67_08235, partial [Terriglobus sp.]